MAEEKVPLFPIKLWIYNSDGSLPPPFEVNELNKELATRIKIAISKNREVRMTDPDDFLVFHAKDGKILFPKQKE